MRRIAASLLPAIALVACAQPLDSAQRQTTEGDEFPASNVQENAVATIDPGTSAEAPSVRNIPAEGPIDPRSAQGAGQVLQSYAALLEQGRFAEARALWTNGGSGSGLSEQDFAQAYAKHSEIHAEIGAPGPIEGAAGSVYVEFPLRFYGRLTNGRSLKSAGVATLRRVNDVPGSTEEQRRWHIYRIDVQPPL